MEESENKKETRKEVVYVQPLGGYPYHAGEDDEISLVDLWLVLVRRKWIILGVTLLCLVLGVGYAWLQPVQYEYRTGIELARVFNSSKPNKSGLSGLELLSSREESIDLLELQIIPAEREEIIADQGGCPRVEVAEGGAEHTLILKTKAEPENSDRVKGLHQQIASSLEAMDLPAFEEAIRIYTGPFEQRKEMLERWLDMLEEQLRNFLSGSDKKNDTQSLIYAYQVDNIRENIAEVNVRIAEAESSIQMIKEASHPTRISFLAFQSEDPVGTGKSLITALSLVLGLMLGVFAAFFVEFLGKARETRQERGTQSRA